MTTMDIETRVDLFSAGLYHAAVGGPGPATILFSRQGPVTMTRPDEEWVFIPDLSSVPSEIGEKCRQYFEQYWNPWASAYARVSNSVPTLPIDAREKTWLTFLFAVNDWVSKNDPPKERFRAARAMNQDLRHRTTVRWFDAELVAGVVEMPSSEHKDQLLKQLTWDMLGARDFTWREGCLFGPAICDPHMHPMHMLAQIAREQEVLEHSRFIKGGLTAVRHGIYSLSKDDDSQLPDDDIPPFDDQYLQGEDYLPLPEEVRRALWRARWRTATVIK